MVAHPFVRSKALFVPLFLWYNEVILSTGGVFLTTLYVTDLDGTLLNAQGRVSSSTAALLRPLVDRGLALTIATARTPATALDLVRPLGLHLPAVMMSGALVYDLGTGRPLATRSLSAESRSALLTLLDRAGRDALVYCVLDGRLVVFHRAPTCDYARSFIAQRSGSPHKQFVQVEHYGQIPLAARCLLTLFCLPCPDRPLLEALQRLQQGAVRTGQAEQGQKTAGRQRDLPIVFHLHELLMRRAAALGDEAAGVIAGGGAVKHHQPAVQHAVYQRVPPGAVQQGQQRAAAFGGQAAGGQRPPGAQIVHQRAGHHHRGQVQSQRAHQVQSGGRGAGGGDGQRQPPVHQRTEKRRRGGTDPALGIQQRAVQIRDVQCGQKNASRGKNDLIVPQKKGDEKRLAPHKRMCYHERRKRGKGT